MEEGREKGRQVKEGRKEHRDPPTKTNDLNLVFKKTRKTKSEKYTLFYNGDAFGGRASVSD